MDLAFLWSSSTPLVVPWPIAIAMLVLVGLVIITVLVVPSWLLVRHEHTDVKSWISERNATTGPTVLDKISFYIDSTNRTIGQYTAWTALFMVLIQFTVVIMRYVFSFGSIQMQESIWYLHGILFMFGAGYTLLHDGHVRVDIWYREASRENKAWVDLIGTVLFLWPVCLYSWFLSWSYVANAWRIKEDSIEPGGIPLIYMLKAVILVFIVLMTLQGLSLAAKSITRILQERARTDAPDSDPSSPGTPTSNGGG